MPTRRPGTGEISVMMEKIVSESEPDNYMIQSYARL